MGRLKADFNGLFGNVLCLSHEDVCLDENGHAVTLQTGMTITAFELDYENDGTPDNIIASGVVEPSPLWLQCKGSKWALMIDENGVRHESDLRTNLS